LARRQAMQVGLGGVDGLSVHQEHHARASSLNHICSMTPSR
jgi:hypothetical protein